ncbi:hypothetical protein PENANT_c043G01237 [Penicillium antarcticum]|uniref:AMP-dependent synthetase/ligase domain-containing protein n=1 Tax=Penicillium antarcticum TaxID=416450 RepID=A0A1V6PSY2_9EURO|nr:uncharacterized protein N7508_002628 [Penicillium antarcticum]KAJ5318120.1 hypothetical protein N7508_002628 [Penicillium antarcticum]OQD79822.1 hypothetical protein PENANT_c043G01237 [Penicillium antarcticum]
MSTEPYLLSEVLAVARRHPFYFPDIVYPPSAEDVKSAREQANGHEMASPSSQKLLTKKDLYKVIERLVCDMSPKNTYRKSCYTSMTGGGSGGVPLFFATDVHENRRHRAWFGQFLNSTGVIKETDWVLTSHFAGHFYRSMDLTAEIIENSGATVLCGGSYMTPAEIIKGLIDYHVNVLSGESSQIVNAVQYISTLPQEQRAKINIEKVVYTSEMLTPNQRAFVETTLGAVSICSMLGSAEAGPWAISNPDLTGNPSIAGSQDFIFDTRAMLIEIFPSSIMEVNSDLASIPDTLPDGESGIIVQTSLHRLRNPLIRYITGDIGSVHALPETAFAQLSERDRPFFRVLRLYGRDRRFSFEWDGMYFEFEALTAMLSSEDCGVLQWQLILDHHETSPRSAIEVRLLCSSGKEISSDALSDRVKAFFNVYSGNQGRLSVTILDDVNGFVRSTTGNKVIKFVDRFN